MAESQSTKRTEKDSKKSEVAPDSIDVLGELKKTFADHKSVTKEDKTKSATISAPETDLMAAFSKGLQSGSTGLAVRGKMPDKFESDTGGEVAAEMVGSLVSDLPVAVVGGLAGGLVGAPTGYGAAIAAGAGAMALPSATRTVLSDAYEKGAPVTFQNWLDRSWNVFRETVKGAVVGGLTGGLGKYAGVAYGATGRILSDVITPTVVTGALEGRIPTTQELASNAASTVAMALVPKVVGRLKRKPISPDAIDPAVVVSETQPTITGPNDNPGMRLVAESDGTGGRATITERPATITDNVKDIWLITSKTVSPELAVLSANRRKGVLVNSDRPGAQDLASATIGGELYLRQRNSDLHVMLDKHRSGLTELEQKAVRPAIKELYDMTPEGKARAAVHAEEAPKVYAAAADIISWFASIKQEVRDYMRVRLMRNLKSDEIEPFRQALDAESPDAAKAIITASVSEPARVKGLIGLYGKYKSIDFWGIEDFVTNIELGSYKVLDDTGHVRAIRETRREALTAYKQLKGDSPDVFTKSFDALLDVEYSGQINPLVRRRGILKGEANVFKSLPIYGNAMYKRMIFEPIEARMNDVFKARPEEFPTNIRATLRRQLKDAKGVYTFADRIVDDFTISMGGKTGKLARGTAVATQTTARLALGFRTSAFAVNMASGYGKIWVKHGLPAVKDGIDFMRSSEGKAFLASEEKLGSLGQNVFIDTAGKVHTTLKWYDPLKVFSWPEPGIRKLNLVVAYREGLGKYGMSEPAAREYARRMLRLTNNTYNAAALAEMFRGSPSKLIMQFKSYLAREIEFIHTLTPTQFNRYIAYQMATAGPRGALIMAKSLPIIGAMGIWSTFENAVNEWRTSRGIPGMLGVDLAPSFSLQFPNEPQDAYGLVFSHLFDLYKNVAKPYMEGESGTDEAMINYIKNLPLITKRWGDVMESIIDEDGYVKGDKGERLYQINSPIDRALLFAGWTTTDLSKKQVAERYLLQQERLMERNRANAMKDITKHLVDPDDLDKKIADYLSQKLLDKNFSDTGIGEILGIWKSDGKLTDEMLQNISKYGITREAIISAYETAKLSPEARLEKRLQLLRKMNLIKK